MGPAPLFEPVAGRTVEIREAEGDGTPVQAGGAGRVNGEQGGDGTRKEEEVPQEGGALPARGLSEKKGQDYRYRFARGGSPALGAQGM